MDTLDEQLAELERLLDAHLPEDYRAFVLADAGRTIQKLQYLLPHPSGTWIEVVDDFLSPEYLLRWMPMELDLRSQGLSDYPIRTLPVANNGNGDTVLLSYRDQDFGAVYFAFHEEGDADDRWAGVYLLASSFSGWLKQLGTISEDKLDA